MRRARLRHVLIAALLTGGLGAALLALGLGTAKWGRAAAMHAATAGTVPARNPAMPSYRMDEINKTS
ncbi:hypothetical protein AB4156_28130 [Cupriavidus sp. 2MCAB6]|uniref:hypothetical protein n=1 Tax=Cupriavidus sp. 2MCAB6 TaxID=3232981 RepID=UPI003F8F9056